ncbi:hypothetical protein EVAR_45244_1 [Eumeta japonica]|uniref:Uncharacterized protein n=1 Tax=Eumeta variegata TaxID=151549 RepID=A0A4C1XBK2_EUMVA|nr:hypothetical protein EVAR_45244_1 [Eumeta japonica]
MTARARTCDGAKHDECGVKSATELREHSGDDSRIPPVKYIAGTLGCRSEGLLLEPESIPVSEFTSYGAPPQARIYSILEVFLFYFSIPVSEFTSCGAPPRARIYSCGEFTSYGLILEPESIPVVSLHTVGSSESESISVTRNSPYSGLVYLFTLQGVASSLWYTPEKITVPKAWFTGSTCLALASSLEYILEVFLFTFQLLFRV